MDKEIWKDIKGFEGLYQVSSFGRVKSLTRKVKSGNNALKPIPEVILKFKINKDGYCVIRPSKDGKHYDKFVHRVVAEAFILNPENKPHVNHKWGNKKDNRAVALEWNTQSENELHAFRTGLKEGRKGSQHHGAKLNESQVKEIKSLYKGRGKGLSQQKIADKFGIGNVQVSRIINDQRWTHIKLEPKINLKQKKPSEKLITTAQ
jgi:hypothetical protein